MDNHLKVAMIILLVMLLLLKSFSGIIIILLILLLLKDQKKQNFSYNKKQNKRYKAKGTVLLKALSAKRQVGSRRSHRRSEVEDEVGWTFAVVTEGRSSEVRQQSPTVAYLSGFRHSSQVRNLGFSASLVELEGYLCGFAA